MRVYISVDMEGIAGVVTGDQLGPSGFEYAKAREFMTGEVLAAIAGARWDYPEHLKGGLKPHAPRERYYFARGPQLVNRVVDISSYMDGKVWANIANVTQGPAGDTGARLRKRRRNPLSYRCWTRRSWRGSPLRAKSP